MELWRLPNGLTSEDFINRETQNTPGAFQGTMWRYAKDRTHVAPAEQTQAVRPQPLDNALVDEARAMGHPVPTPDTGWTEEHAQAQAAANEVQADNYQSLRGVRDDELSAMRIEDLKEMAAALGIAKLNVSKQKLIEAILAKQG